MSQRISDEQLAKLAGDFARNAMLSGFLSYEVVAQGFLDLRDARARIRELEALSASQAETLDAIDCRVKL
jgi:hypothetical protein